MKGPKKDEITESENHLVFFDFDRVLRAGNRGFCRFAAEVFLFGFVDRPPGKESKVLAETVQWTDRQAEEQKELYERTLDVHVNFFDVHGEPDWQSNMGLKNGTTTSGSEKCFGKRERGGVQTAVRGDYLHAVTVPVQFGNEVAGAIWLSLDMEEVNQSLRQVWVSLVLGLLIAYALAAFFSSRIAGGVTRPLEEITQVA